MSASTPGVQNTTGIHEGTFALHPTLGNEFNVLTRAALLTVVYIAKMLKDA